MSLRLTPKAHKKNRVVMRMKGARKRRSVMGTDRPPCAAVPGEFVIHRLRYVSARSKCAYPPSTNRCWPVM